MKDILEQKQNQFYRKYLYSRGYLLTDNDSINFSEYPFYNNWSMVSLYKYKIFIHVRQNCFVYDNNSEKFFIIGHCYNPFCHPR